MQPAQPFKVCPKCQSPADLHASQCLNCGRVYRTQFDPIQQTQVFNLPSRPDVQTGNTIPANPLAKRSAHPLVIASIALVVFAFFLRVLFVMLNGSISPEPDKYKIPCVLRNPGAMFVAGVGKANGSTKSDIIAIEQNTSGFWSGGFIEIEGQKYSSVDIASGVYTGKRIMVPLYEINDQ